MTYIQVESPAPRLHRDGTITFFSYYKQEWIRKAFYVPVEEIERMSPRDRARIERHLDPAARPA